MPQQGVAVNLKSNFNNQRRMAMEKTVIWESVFDKALARAKNEKKFVVLDFFNPG